MTSEVPPEASVLLVDDKDANLLALEALLEPLGCNLVRADSGRAALRQLLFRDFAVILLDVMMPDLDGVATAALIKKRQATRHIPIIFLTGVDTQARIMSQAYAQGAVDYLVKPFDPGILRSKVAVFVELYRKSQELKAQTEIARQREVEAAESRLLYEEERSARAHAEEIARTRQEAVAVVSHDLRNPMNAISTSATLMAMAIEKGNTDGLLARVQTIQNAVSRMNALIRDLLDTTRIQSGGLTIHLLAEDLSVIVGQIVQLLTPILAAKKQTFEIALPEGGVFAAFDRERIFQVLSNLVGNASKFSPEGTAITIRATAATSEILVEVIDRGAGISSEHLPRIFEPYWRASQQRQTGLGLGLAIAKGIIDAHRCRIWVESRVGEGSRFCFTLPMPDAAELPAEGNRKAG
ncbi:MAG TPA: hybrid sensor histidine kinase/response regulator [Polyangiaceae bacterium]|jgi:signal transduction histidine kinase|nr:hybrid sensor histidine kinase/response regulator [Polyangiaceae bacterium]